MKENTFSDITFDVININGYSKLKTVNINAFNTTDQVTTLIIFEGNPILTSPDNSIFEILSKFIRASVIALVDNNNITCKVVKMQSSDHQYIQAK